MYRFCDAYLVGVLKAILWYGAKKKSKRFTDLTVALVKVDLRVLGLVDLLQALPEEDDVPAQDEICGELLNSSYSHSITITLYSKQAPKDCIDGRRIILQDVEYRDTKTKIEEFNSFFSCPQNFLALIPFYLTECCFRSDITAGPTAT